MRGKLLTRSRQAFLPTTLRARINVHGHQAVVICSNLSADNRLMWDELLTWSITHQNKHSLWQATFQPWHRQNNYNQCFDATNQFIEMTGRIDGTTGSCITLKKLRFEQGPTAVSDSAVHSFQNSFLALCLHLAAGRLPCVRYWDAFRFVSWHRHKAIDKSGDKISSPCQC